MTPSLFPPYRDEFCPVCDLFEFSRKVIVKTLKSGFGVFYRLCFLANIQSGINCLYDRGTFGIGFRLSTKIIFEMINSYI